MTTLRELKPVKKHLVMNLLQSAGFDVSDWSNYKGRNPATNPKYCYNWSFEQPGEMFAVCLWHSSIEDGGSEISCSFKPSDRRIRSTEPGSAIWNKRSNDLQDRIRRAYQQQLPIRVIVVDGKRRDPEDTKPVASKVSARLLDHVAWAVKDYNLRTGEWVLVRGAKPFALAIDSSDDELAYFEGKSRWKFVLHRKREGELRRKKISQALSQGRLVCEVPQCGFDFEKRYGELGKD